ncbi:MAG: hypothetical protein ACMUHY_00545 [Thermoplasmatota archaeon]
MYGESGNRSLEFAVIGASIAFIAVFSGISAGQGNREIPIDPDEMNMGTDFIVTISDTDTETAVEARYPGAENSWIFQHGSRDQGVLSFELPAVYCGTNITYRTLEWDPGSEDGRWHPVSEWKTIDLVGWIDDDGDGLSDLWEDLHDIDIDDPNDDSDGDQLILLEEMYYLTDPSSTDSDGDSMDDRWEALEGTLPFRDDPNDDPDGDFWSNIQERAKGTKPRDPLDHPDEPPATPWYWMLIIVGVLLLILGYFVKQLFNKRKLEDDMDDFDSRTARNAVSSRRDNSGKV